LGRRLALMTPNSHTPSWGKRLQIIERGPDPHTHQES